MTIATRMPSEEQLGALQRVPDGQPLALFYQYSLEPMSPGDPCHAALAKITAENAGRLIWAGRGEQVLIGNDGAYQHSCLLEFASAHDVAEFVGSPAHARALDGVPQLEVVVMNAQPAKIRWISTLFARVLPLWPFDNTVEPGDEPGVGTSDVMPTHDAIRELKGHADPAAPVVMVNWLKFRRHAEYTGGQAQIPANGQAVSGREAYYRYGKTALLATHSIGAKLLYACRYRHVLIGNGGDPAAGRWDEFALMQYPGRAGFALMTSLRRYRKALHHREAGLAAGGQSLTVTRPLDPYTWRG
jgi:hypothetical protein